MRGPKPKPTVLKQRAGNPGKRALNKREPKPRMTIPRCPAHLKGMARREWKRIVDDLFAAGLLTVVDRAALAAYCAAYGRWELAERKLRESGSVLTILTDKGNVIQNPLVGVANRAMADMVKYAVEFGMTPSARSRIHVDPPSGNGSLADALFRDVVQNREQ